ncbi:MAG: hypothetical protein J5501_06025 [Ruminococcus sp.]|nr:hypothetical protein [Ruminococcus sp.]
MKRKLLAVLMSAAVLASVPVCLSSCGGRSYADSIISEIDQKNYAEALEIYRTKGVKAEDQDRFAVELRSRVTEAVSAYAANDLDYESVTSLIETVKSFDLPGIADAIASSERYAGNLNYSKDGYERGVASFNSEDYISAYSYFKRVLEADANYASAEQYLTQSVDKFCAGVTERTNASVAEGKYDEAIDYLTQTLAVSGFNQAADEMVRSLLDTTRIQAIMLHAQEFEAGGDLSGAINYLSAAKNDYDVENSPEINEYQTRLTDQYIADKLAEANKLADEGNYDAAVRILDDANVLVPSDHFTAASARIARLKPVYLRELECMESNRFESGRGEKIVDTYNNTYPTENLYFLSGKKGLLRRDIGYAGFALGGKYTTLKGVIAIDSLSDDTTGVMKIEGDGKVLYTIDLSRSTAPVELNIDVSKVGILNVSVDAEDTGTIYVILSNIRFIKA